MEMCRRYAWALVAAGILAGCGGGEDEPVAATAPPRYLYVTSGTCYSGTGLTTFTNLTSSNQLFRLNLTTGTKELLADFYASPSNTGDSPVDVVSESATSLLVLIENTTTAGLRRIERLSKAPGSSRVTYTGNVTALSGPLRAMTLLSDGYLLVSKSTAIEKIRDGSNRLMVGTGPWVNLTTPASACTTSATLITSVKKLGNGSIVFAHAGTGASRIGIVAPLGYQTALSCMSAQAAPAATAYPTAMVYDSANKILLVSYGGSSTAADLNSIYAYSIDEETGVISNPQKIYDSNGFGSTYNYLLFGISAMTYDATSGDLFVSTSVSTGTTVSNYRIERLHYTPSLIGSANSSVLAKVSTFYDFGSDTKCISDLMVAD
jgi:hypothetical protein